MVKVAPTAAFAADAKRRLEAIKQAKVCARIEQGQMLRLPVDVDQQRAQFPQQSNIHRAPVDARHTTSLFADFAHQHHIIGIVH